jgi:hypothetical protein
MGGCTAWLVSNGAFLTAGHCADFDPDQGGPMLPDGVLDLNGVVEFNVPASQANGRPVAAAMNDQYPIDVTRVRWNFNGSGTGLGRDWAVFAVRPNANTGLLPHQAYGEFFRMTSAAPAVNAAVTVIGYGLDNTPAGTGGMGAPCCDTDGDGTCNNNCNAQSVTQQQSGGPYLGRTANSGNVFHEYQADTEGANSGSPIILSGDLTIGIHTNGGCDDDDGNIGTSFEHNLLEAALQNFLGPNTVYVDGVTFNDGHNGTIFRPLHTVREGRDAAADGGILSIVPGRYNERLTFNRQLTIRAPIGGVTIGN